MKQQILIFLITILSSISASGKVVLPSVFSDNMVLQQRSDVAIWGWASAGETLRIVCSWNSTDTLKVKADNTAAWRTTMKTFGAGGPYTIAIFGSSNVQLRNVMLGEVWVCSGQSNMEWSVNAGITVSQDEIDKADNPNIRIF
ncbi:MAG TPA: sialate O-acetylesterase, partial [Chryseosolibacter sp.]